MMDPGIVVATTPARRPRHTVLEGRTVRIAPLDPVAHAPPLYQSIAGRDELWRYLAEGPFSTQAAFEAHMRQKAASVDPLFFAIVDQFSGDALGYAAYMRIEPTHRVVEIGNILFAPALQRTVGATEAMYLMARHVFEDLGYRRYEWKCNSLNEPSRRAALRLGFQYEGIFRRHMIVKGRNRDTAWFSMLDSEWPARKRAFEQWLAPANFDEDGRQRKPLSAFA